MFSKRGVGSTTLRFFDFHSSENSGVVFIYGTLNCRVLFFITIDSYPIHTAKTCLIKPGLTKLKSVTVKW